MSTSYALKQPDVCNDFKYAHDSQATGYDDVHEMETKVLVDNAFSEELLLESLNSRRALFSGDCWSRIAYSSYFDTTDLDLYRSGQGLRLNYDKDGNYEISSKGNETPLGDHGISRIKLNALLESMSLDLPALFNACGENRQARDYMAELVQKFDNDPMSLREALFISCETTRFNACVYLITKNNKTQARFASQLNGDARIAKPVYFEFAVDRSSFFVPGLDEPIHRDTEIEWEFKSKSCFYVPKNDLFESAPDLTVNDIMVANAFLSGFVERELGQQVVSWNSDSKLSRGLTQILKQSSQGRILPLQLEFPTVGGKKLESVIEAPEHYFIKKPQNINPVASIHPT